MRPWFWPNIGLLDQLMQTELLVKMGPTENVKSDVFRPYNLIKDPCRWPLDVYKHLVYLRKYIVCYVIQII